MQAKLISDNTIFVLYVHNKTKGVIHWPLYCIRIWKNSSEKAASNSAHQHLVCQKTGMMKFNCPCNQIWEHGDHKQSPNTVYIKRHIQSTKVRNCKMQEINKRG